MRKGYRFVFAILFIIVILALIFLVFYPKDDNFEFSISRCDSEISNDSESEDGIISQKWLDEKTLVVEGYVRTYCAGVKIDGNYIIDNDNLILRYNLKIGTGVAKCICPYRLTYKLVDIEHKDYFIKLERFRDR